MMRVTSIPFADTVAYLLPLLLAAVAGWRGRAHRCGC
jgi:hypothetical protein